MTNILLIALVLLVLVLNGMFLLFYRTIKAFEANLKDFILPTDDKTPSHLSKSIEIVADMIARSIMAQAKGFLMGLQSGENRATAAVQADIAEGQGNPVLSGVLKSFPSLKRTLRRNPALLDLAMNFLSRRTGSAVGPAPDKSNGQVKFNL